MGVEVEGGRKATARQQILFDLQQSVAIASLFYPKRRFDLEQILGEKQFIDGIRMKPFFSNHYMIGHNASEKNSN
jgi:hypothetical protein